MILLHQYIFAKVYYFYKRVFKEKEIPHWFAGAIVSIILNFLLSGLYYFLLYFYYPNNLLKNISGYSGYIGLVSGILIVIYVSRGDRYKKILLKVEHLNKSKRRRLGVISILYVVTVISFVIITVNLSREAHLGHI